MTKKEYGEGSQKLVVMTLKITMVTITNFLAERVSKGIRKRTKTKISHLPIPSSFSSFSSLSSSSFSSLHLKTLFYSSSKSLNIRNVLRPSQIYAPTLFPFTRCRGKKLSKPSFRKGWRLLFLHHHLHSWNW